MSDFDQTWGSANPDAKGDNEPPEPGTYDVALTDAAAWVAKSGKTVMKLSYAVMPDGQQWTAIFGFASQKAANVAKGQARDLGVDIDNVHGLDELDGALKALIGGYFTVDVQQNGDFVNTYVKGRMLGSDIPDVPVPEMAPAATASGGDDDADIPFAFPPVPSRFETAWNSFV